MTTTHPPNPCEENNEIEIAVEAVLAKESVEGNKVDPQQEEKPDEITVKVSRLLEIIKDKLDKLNSNDSFSVELARPKICALPFHSNITDTCVPVSCTIGPIFKEHCRTSSIEKKKLETFVEDKMGRDWMDFVERNKEMAATYYLKDVVSDMDSFVITLAVDAHFILFELIKYYDHLVFGEHVGTTSSHPWESRYRDLFEWRDPIHHDFLLLPNQIPFFTLQGLFDLIPNDERPHSITLSHLLKYFFSIKDLPDKGVVFDHLLHFYHQGLSSDHSQAHFSRRNRQSIFSYIQNNLCFPWFCCFHFHRSFHFYREPTASTSMELHDAGIKFMCNFNACNFLDICFENGNLKIPTWTINDYTFSVIYNLLSLEKSQPDGDTPVTSCAKFLCDLVRSKDDYKLLAEKRVIQARDTDFGFNKLIQLKAVIATLDFEETFLTIILRRIIHSYLKEPQHQWRAKLVKEYFSSPWSIVGWIAGGVLFVLTLLQTIYTMQAYYYPPS